MRIYSEGNWVATGPVGLVDRCGIGTKTTRVFDGVPREVTIPLAVVYNATSECGADDAVLMASAKVMLDLLKAVNDWGNGKEGATVPFPAIAALVSRLT